MASLIVVVVVALDAWGIWVFQHTPDSSPLLMALLLCETVLAPVTGWVIVWRHPRHIIGWLLLIHGVLTAPVLIGDGYAEYGAIVKPGSLPGPAWGALIGDDAWPLLYVCLAVIGFIFPDGRFLSRGWRRFVLVSLAGYAAFILTALFSVDHFDGRLSSLASPLPVLPTPVLAVGAIFGLVSIAASLVGSIVSARLRLKRAEGEERIQMLWFVWAALSIPGGLAACWLDLLLTGGIGDITFVGVVVFGTALPLAIGIAILRVGLFDIQLVLSRTLTYGALLVLVVAVYGVAALGIGSFFENSSGARGAGGLIGTGVVAVAISPVSTRIRRRVERWVYGDRSDPTAALRRLSDRLQDALDPTEVLDTVGSTIADALRVDAAWVEVSFGVTGRVPVQAAGSTSDQRVVPLVYQGNPLGSLVVQVPRSRPFTAADERLLTDLSQYAATAVHAVRLTLALQLSRERLVAAREEERRRLRRDLHDGLGPALAAMVLKLKTIATLVPDPRPASLLDQVRNEARDAVSDIRRLVYDLRPPALDEVGLVGALQHVATRLSADSSGPQALRIDVLGPRVGAGSQLDLDLPAATEVAAYRIASEAMTNAARHSGASRCTVTVDVNGALTLEVGDNGVGMDPAAPAGIGMSSMRERAAELGGSCSIGPRPGGGTVVRAVLPVALPLTSDGTTRDGSPAAVVEDRT